jgi:hypothetical protein
MMPPNLAMSPHQIGSSVLLAGGVLLVFAGLTTALGVSVSGIVASSAAIAALLYAGGVWFGGAQRPDVSVVLFTPQLLVAAGPLAGRRVVDLFPADVRGALETHCLAALTGESQRFAAADGQTFEAAPVRRADGAVVYGVLITAAAATRVPASAVAAG